MHHPSSWPSPTNLEGSSHLSSRPACFHAVTTAEFVSVLGGGNTSRRSVDESQKPLRSANVNSLRSPSDSGLCGAFCLLCLGCSIASDMDECCLCGAQMPMRSVYRTKYNINVSLHSVYLSLCDFMCRH